MRHLIIAPFMLIAAALFSPVALAAEDTPCPAPEHPTVIAPKTGESDIAKDLGWVDTDENRCGGYYLEPAFNYPKDLPVDKIIITSDQYLFTQQGTSIGQGNVTLTRSDQQIIANKAYLYSYPTTLKLCAIDLQDHVTLREPNSIVVANHGRYDVKTKTQTLYDILYRTTIYSRAHPKPVAPTKQEAEQARKIVQLSAWGDASEFKQDQPKIYNMQEASYSTCPPTSVAWRIKAHHIELNKITGRGVATHTRLYLKNIPVFYMPYFNFPIDSRRQTGLLTPELKNGIHLPFYWNIAPNYDTTITPAYIWNRGGELSDTFRYLTPESRGDIRISVLPDDQLFKAFQARSQIQYQSSPNLEANLRRLENASTTRSTFGWRNDTRYNDHWSSNIDYSHVSDDYYLRDLNSNLNEVTQNQLLQQAQVNYRGQYWNMLGRVAGYQTLHPIDQAAFINQYSRLPQLSINGDYPSAPFGLDFFINDEATHFDIRHTPGDDTPFPIGNRVHIQPGVTLPYSLPYLTLLPRIQVAMTQYDISNVALNNSRYPSRALPIFDMSSTLYLERQLNFFSNNYLQTLEPQIYYTYVPFKLQDEIPLFDTTLNTLTYAQLFTYNRFSGLDRIGDANQISVGVTTRFIDQDSGVEKLRAGLGQIIYFRDRLVTLCTGTSCASNPIDPSNRRNRSPLSGMINYKLNPVWSLTADTIWNPQTDKIDNQSVALHYQPDPQRIINLGYGFIRNGDLEAGGTPDSYDSNLAQTDASFYWPISRDWNAVGRWTENWNRHRLQNLLYGLQYDSCCWAIRFVAGQMFTNLTPNNTNQYKTVFIAQFALKGLGNAGVADPSQLLTGSVYGYQSNFGQDF